MSGGGSPDFASVDYVPSGVTSHYNHRIHVFLPNAPQPATGYPSCTYFLYTGWNSTSLVGSIGPENGLLYLLLKSGWAIVIASATISGQTITSGGSLVANKGVFTPPAVPIIFYNSAYQCAEKDAMWVVQHLRRNASTYRIDPNRIGVTGNSAGGNIALFASFCPDVQGSTGFDLTNSSRPNFCVVRFCPVAWYAALNQSTAAAYAIHMPDSSDILYTTSASTLSQVSAADQKAGSPLEYAWNPSMAWASDPVATFDWLEARQKDCRNKNRKVKLYLYGATDDGLSDAFDCQDDSTTTFSGVGLPAGTVAHNHNVWNTLAFKYEASEAGMRFAPFGEHSRCAIAKSDYDHVAANSPTPTDLLSTVKVITHTGGGTDDPLVIDQVDFLNTVAGLKS